MDIYLLIIVLLVLGYFLYKYLSFYNKCKKIKSKKGMTGFDAAKLVLDKYELDNYIVLIKGTFNDNYNYKHNVIKLSANVYNGDSIYSTFMGAYVAMQAVFHKEENKFYEIKKELESIYKVMLLISYLLLIFGLILRGDLTGGIALLIICLIYQLIFLKNNLDIIKRINKEFETSFSTKENMNNYIKVLGFFDIAGILLNVKEIVNYIFELINKE